MIGEGLENSPPNFLSFNLLSQLNKSHATVQRQLILKVLSQATIWYKHQSVSQFSFLEFFNLKFATIFLIHPILSSAFSGLLTVNFLLIYSIIIRMSSRQARRPAKLTEMVYSFSPSNSNLTCEISSRPIRRLRLETRPGLWSAIN